MLCRVLLRVKTFRVSIGDAIVNLNLLVDWHKP